MTLQAQQLPRNEGNDVERHRHEALTSLIREQVMHMLGEPDALNQVQVRRLWQGHYRVNVLVGANPTSIKIANSYFLQTDDDGNITNSNPKIAKQYFRAKS